MTFGKREVPMIRKELPHKITINGDFCFLVSPIAGNFKINMANALILRSILGYIKSKAMKKTAQMICVLTVAFIILSCQRRGGDAGNNPNDSTGKKMPHIVASGKKLMTEDGKEFKAWGFNWGNGMLEDVWTSDWNGLVGDFEEMKGYGANSVRIPLQYEAFMVNATTPNQSSIQKLKQLVKVAEDNGLYLIVCGLNAFEKQSQPEWYSNMNEAERWATQAVFWEAVGGAIGKSPAVLTYDLMNEPTIAASPERGWLPGDGMGGYFFAQNITLDLAGRTSAEVMRSWIRKMTEAIRKKDSKHLITVGFIPFHVFAQFSPDLDMMSTHLYPKSGKTEVDAVTIQKYQSDKPLLISEVFTLTCSDVELQQFIVAQNKYVSGWIWHYNGKTIEELEASGTIPDAIYRLAILKFREMAPTQK